jgi:hypothetical protein
LEEISSQMDTRLVQIASSFTAVPLARGLRAAVVNAGVAHQIGFAQYSQVAEYMLGPMPDSDDIVGTVILVRIEDWLRDDLKSLSPDNAFDYVQKARQNLRVRVDEFAGQVRALARRGKPVWFLACPSAGWIAERHKIEALCRTYTNLLIARIQNLSQVTVLSWPAASLPGDFTDRNTDRLGQIPFTLETFDQLGNFLGEQIQLTAPVQDLGKDRGVSAGVPELAAYLAGLQVRIRLTPARREDRSHVDRILRTAAAFSLTGEKRDLSDSEVDCLLRSDGCLLIDVSDRLANYGPSGIVSFRVHGESLNVEALALSCPVLGKQVEYGVLSGLAQIAAERACRRVVFEYRTSGRNEIMSAFLKSVSDEESQTRYVLLVAEAGERIAKTAVAPGTWTLESPRNLLELEAEP